jgi:ribosomal protein S18 acetylase RimI-like enzyme
MSKNLLHGIVTKKILSVDDISAIQQLAAICERYEHMRLRISWGMLQTRPGDFPLDFLYYNDGKIVGYLALDDRGIESKEMFGMVHPAYRRQGIFRSLFRVAVDICRVRGVKRMILTCERIPPAGQAFVKAMGATYDFSEHEMVLTKFRPSFQFNDHLTVRVANVGDIDALVAVQCAAFGDQETKVRWRVKTFMADPLCRYYIALFQSPGREKTPSISNFKRTIPETSSVFAAGEKSVGNEVPVGSLRLELDDEIGIYAFGVHASYQGRGYGRQILEEAINQIRKSQETSQKGIMLDVETDNIRALNLYRSCGFEIRATYDYYKIYIQS